ncbi:MAG: helix-turn-helix domain-containing protein [Oscillospiraceae bacterium]|nr:helix-turn-helix domain-containing protein [Oscillospiraceae bacterium]
MSIKEVAELLGIKYHSAQTLFHCKSFPKIMIGRRLFVREVSLYSYLERAEKTN